MRRLLAVLALGAFLAAPAAAEVWNDPGGVSVTATSQTVTFPRHMSSVLILNDDATNEVYIRLFTCGDTVAAATTASLEIKLGKSRTFTKGETEPNYYCAVSLVCDTAETATIRIEAK